VDCQEYVDALSQDQKDHPDAVDHQQMAAQRAEESLGRVAL
jgi:hypothetical protein